jgi:protein TonB
MAEECMEGAALDGLRTAVAGVLPLVGPNAGWPRWRSSRLVLLLVVLIAHVVAGALLLGDRVRAPAAESALPIEAELITDNQAPLAPVPPSVQLEQPPIEVVAPDIRITLPEPDFPSAVHLPPPAAPAAPGPGPAELSAPRFDAAYLNNPPPAYPASARRLHEQGTVLLRVRVSAQGAPLEVLIDGSSGSPRLDEAAMAAVRQWRFVPAQRGAAPLEAWVLIPLEFVLHRQR